MTGGATHTTTPNPPDLAREAAPALEVIRMLASEVGPRRPCSDREALAGKRLAGWLEVRGVHARLAEFPAYASFGHPYLALLGAALAGGLLQGRSRRGSRRVGAGVSAAALAAIALEGDLRLTPVSRLFSRRRSANLLASVAPKGDVRRRVCLSAHMDATRSGLMFHPRLVRLLPILLQVPVVSAASLAAWPLIRRLPGAPTMRRAALGGLGFGLFMLAERELRGEDVPGANDNASGCGVVAQLATEHAARPLEHTQVDLLVTGCEESGLLGAQAYFRSQGLEARGATYLNVDTVGAAVPLTYILREGAGVSRPASPRLIELAKRVGERRPDLGLRPAAHTPGLPTDATVALTNGCEAITFLAQADTVPNWHLPSDTYENVDARTVGKAVAAVRELLRELDAEVA